MGVTSNLVFIKISVFGYEISKSFGLNCFSINSGELIIYLDHEYSFQINMIHAAHLVETLLQADFLDKSQVKKLIFANANPLKSLISFHFLNLGKLTCTHLHLMRIFIHLVPFFDLGVNSIICYWLLLHISLWLDSRLIYFCCVDCVLVFNLFVNRLNFR